MINHIGIIPDGSRRWAHKNNASYYESYNIAMKLLNSLIKQCFKLKIKNTSLYLLSKENLSRSKSDLEAVLKAEYEFVSDVLPETCGKKCKVIHAGIKSLLPPYFSQSIECLETQTEFNDEFRLFLLIAYNPFEEIRFGICGGKTNEKFNISHLQVPEMVDLIIRTGGGKPMLSNFLPLQSAYSPIILLDEYFNDFSVQKFNEIVIESREIQRNLGI